jgi:hypothetical protein
MTARCHRPRKGRGIWTGTSDSRACIHRSSDLRKQEQMAAISCGRFSGPASIKSVPCLGVSSLDLGRRHVRGPLFYPRERHIRNLEPGECP